MLYRGSPKAIRVCAGLFSFLLLGFLVYTGVFDELIRAIGAVGYEFLRALNND